MSAIQSVHLMPDYIYIILIWILFAIVFWKFQVPHYKSMRAFKKRVLAAYPDLVYIETRYTHDYPGLEGKKVFLAYLQTPDNRYLEIHEDNGRLILEDVKRPPRINHP